MNSPTVTLSRDEARKLADYLGSLDYEYGLIIQDLQSDEERDSFNAKNERAGAMATQLALLTPARGPIVLPRSMFATIMADLDWLTEEWTDAIGYMDIHDAATYRPRLAGLERYIAQMRDR